MNETNNPRLTAFSKSLRKHMTKEERKLWYDFLKSLSVNVNRQKVLGNYIVDFYCASAKIVIELDGSQHREPLNMEQDAGRDKYLSDIGLTVLRYTNLEISQNFKGVCEDILRHLSV